MPHLVPPRGGIDIGDYSLRDFAAKWLVQQSDFAEVGRYRADNRALAGDPDPRRRIVFIGDSITEFWDGLACLETDEWRVLNRGIAGQNSTQMLLRFEDDAIAIEPSLIVLLCGTNDLRAYVGTGADVSPSAQERIGRNVSAMADIARGRGLAMVICGLPPVGTGLEVHRDPAALIAVNCWLRACASSRALEFVDYHSALADAEGTLGLEYSEDGVHPNPKGYERMLGVLRPALAAHGLCGKQSEGL